MRFIWINILAIVIALTSVVTEGPTVNFSFEQISSLQSIPLWQSDALKNPSDKNADKNYVIAQDFIPIVLLADGQNQNQSFQYYLPIYNLHRQKEYFLLI